MAKVEKSNFQNLCRGCLLNLDTAGNSAISLSEESNCDRFSSCTSIPIKENDDLPKNLCSECMEKCNTWYNFKKQCEQSNEILQRLIEGEAEIESHENLDPLIFAFPTNSSEIQDLDSVLLSEIGISVKKDIVDIAEDVQIDQVFEESLTVDSNEGEEKPPEKGKSAKKTKTSRNNYHCLSCSKTFRNEERYEAHLREHKGLKPEVCKICNKEFNNVRALRRHRIKHDDLKKFTCGICGNKYKYATSLTLHAKTHKNIRSYICDLCGKSFIRAHGLQSHLLSHSTETPFSCEECGKKFKNQVMLKNHQMRHKGIKRFICSVCGKTFTTSPELTTHSRSHTGCKPFGCSLCDKSYKTKSHLAVHMRFHSGLRPYVCDLCPQKFAHNKVLKQHRLTHTGERPFMCEICQRPFRQKSTLKSHLRTHRQPETSPQEDQFSVATYLGDVQAIGMHQNEFIAL